MRVKRLEIQGFKSFKDKTVIHFDHGITGIVGPNGCGKSNIVDAFFWVMGEQSYKHMRGTGSDDLIFNGSSKYNPLGLAEATLVMETDVADTSNAPAGATVQDIPVHLKSKEVSVTRRLYRSGEGEYFINGTPARLKDIQELFMDTGVGAKGYSVIEQGQIGKIVNSKPEERRLLVEEAAGIAKYKARKKESLRKMEATQANLSRLADVIQEIERNLGSLERQSQKARQYKKYKDELLDKEMTWGRRKAQVLRQKLEVLRKDREAMEQELVGLRAELQTAENAIEADRVDQVTDTKAAEELQAKIEQISGDLARDRSALDLSKRRQGDLADQLNSLDAEKSELITVIEADSTRISEREEEAGIADESFSRASEEAQSMDERVRAMRSETEQSRRELETEKKNLMAGITQASDLTSRAASLLTRMESARAQAERLAQQADAAATKLSQAREESEKASESVEAIRAKREGLQEERKAQAERVQEQEQRVRQLEREDQESNRSLTQLRSKLQSLEELAEAHEGLSDAPKAALDWAKDQKTDGKLGALADSLEVSGELEPALEGWLEARLQDLVSSDSAMALGAIERAAQARQGRLAIHLGGNSAPASIAYDKISAILAQAGFDVVGEMSSLVSASNEAARKAISCVCVVRSFAPMAAFLAAGGMTRLSGWGVASLDGSALDASGILRGGAGENSGAAALLRRKRAIADLEVQIREAEERHAQSEAALAEARKALELLRARHQSLQGEIQTLEIQAAAVERDVHQSSRALKDAESHLELLELEKKELEEESESARLDREKAQAELEGILSSRSELESRISSMESELSSRETVLRERETELQTLRVNEASSRERATSLKRELEAARAMIGDRKRRLQEIERIVERASQERNQFSGGESSLEQRIVELTKAAGDARESLAAVKDRLERSGAALSTALERIKELHKAGDEKTTETNNLALETEKLSGELTHLIQNLEEKYGQGCLELPVTSPIQEEMTDPVVTREMTAEEEQALGEEVEKLRERIRRLGEVNVGAIEEYEETKKRYDYLIGEKQDLERSIVNLQEAIEHINKTSEERFRRAFEAIADRFERLFPIIFGGGRAELSLVYPEGSTDILEAGVDILAQPPGKKVSNIALLSGGEKALTAVSLIFAIFMVKPSPFCVLDEVDAPLDDANIGKFNALLREMAAKSQFILITHNKKTMELNDTLYGVTMEEPGVSKMISIELQ